MARTFNQMVAEAVAAVPAVSLDEARRRLEQGPGTLVVDGRDASDLDGTGIIPGAANVSLGTLPYQADHGIDPAWRDPCFADLDRPDLVTRELGPPGELGPQLITEMGYRNVAFIGDGMHPGRMPARRPPRHRTLRSPDTVDGADALRLSE